MATRRIRWVLTLALLALAVPGCEYAPTGEEQAAIDRAFAQGVNAGPADPLPSPPPACFAVRFTQPEAEITRKIDLIFVTDTSGSLVEERGESDGLHVSTVSRLTD